MSVSEQLTDEAGLCTGDKSLAVTRRGAGDWQILCVPDRSQDDQKHSVAVGIGSGWDDEVLQVTNSRHEKCQEGGKVLQ